MAGRKCNLLGQRFGRLTVIKENGKDSNRAIMWDCLCDCGNQKRISSCNLRNGTVLSCGCLQLENKYKHGNCTRKLISGGYFSWRAMKQRCLNPNSPSYKCYGGRGITICKRWKNNFENFLADMGKRPPKFTLERINNNGNYELSSCKWATRKEQMNNRNYLRK